MPIAGDTLPGFNLAVGPALAAVPALARATALAALPAPALALNPRPPGAERLVGTREALRI